jgi:hypothetical protein
MVTESKNNNKFRVSYCDPLKATPSSVAILSTTELIPHFKNFPWVTMFEKMSSVNKDDIHFSPSLKFENTEDESWLEISLVEIKDNIKEFYIFYSTPPAPNKTKETEVLKLLDVSETRVRSLIRDFSIAKHPTLTRRFASINRHSKPKEPTPNKTLSETIKDTLTLNVRWYWYLPHWVWAFLLPWSIALGLYPKKSMTWGEWAILSCGISALPLIFAPLFTNGYYRKRVMDVLILIVIPALIAYLSYSLLKLIGII